MKSSSFSKMNCILFLIGAIVLITNPKVEGFAPNIVPVRRKQRTPMRAEFPDTSAQHDASIVSETKRCMADMTDVNRTNSRRSFLNVISLAAGSAFVPSRSFASDDVSQSIPMVSLEEFEKILKTSAKSVQLVELYSYSNKSQTAIVTLVDGAVFGISDLVESSTDPRSPLNLVATLRGYNVPYKFPLLEAALSKTETSGKRKVYLNEAAIVAGKKEEAKRKRIANDEVDRLAAVRKLNL